MKNVKRLLMLVSVLIVFFAGAVLWQQPSLVQSFDQKKFKTAITGLKNHFLASLGDDDGDANVVYIIADAAQLKVLPSDGVLLENADAIVLTRNFAALPKDLIAHPLVGDFFRKEIVFKYEDSQAMLGFSGLLKRLAFEHELSIDEKLTLYLLGKPAEVALWKAYDGRLSRFLVSFKHSGLRRAVYQILSRVRTDTQLQLVGKKMFDGQEVPVFKLSYSHGRFAYLTLSQKRLFIYSDREMQLPDVAWYHELIEEHPYKMKLAQVASGPTPVTLGALYGATAGSKHSIVMGAKYASFGFQRFFPSLVALQLDFDDEKWRHHVLTTHAEKSETPDYSSIWKAFPNHAAACVALPVEPKRFVDVLKNIMPKTKHEVFLNSIASPVGVCWYPNSTLYTPLFIVRTKGLSGRDKLLKNYFTTFINGDSETSTKTKKLDRGIIWQRDVRSRYGLFENYFKVALGFIDNYLVFSPDHTLVENVFAVRGKRLAALADTLPTADQEPFVFVSPAKVTTLLRASINASLPAKQESVFRKSIQKFLEPVLNTYARRKNIAFAAPKQDADRGVAWQELKWVEF